MKVLVARSTSYNSVEVGERQVRERWKWSAGLQKKEDRIVLHIYSVVT
jgi:hypothetical protein